LPVVSYRYWNDELRERQYRGVGSRMGAELLIRREWLQPHLDAGATLCWVVTLSIAQRGEYEEQFGEPQVVGTWPSLGAISCGPNPGYLRIQANPRPSLQRSRLARALLHPSSPRKHSVISRPNLPPTMSTTKSGCSLANVDPSGRPRY
jgi:hypothetical protein